MLMSPPTTTEILNRVLVLHSRSLPMYLSYAKPDRLFANPKAQAVLEQITADQQRTVDRLATFILDHGGTIDPGEFPMAFTGLHDLSVEYLLKQMIDRQKRHIAACERMADMLDRNPFAQAAVREAVGEAKGHLENLEELRSSLE